MNHVDKMLDALKVYGNYLIDKESAAKLTLITQDPTESEYVKGFNRGEHAGYLAAYNEFKYMLEGLLK